MRLRRTFDGGIGFTDAPIVRSSAERRYFIGTGLGLLIGGLAAAGGGIASAEMSSSAAGKATDANTAASTQATKVAEDTLDENKREFDQTQQNNWDQYLYKQKQMAPYIGLGTAATNTLSKMLRIPIAQVAPPPTPNFGTAPTTTMPAGGQTTAPPPDVQQPGGMDSAMSTPTLNTMLTTNYGAGPVAGTQATAPTQAAGLVLLRAPNGQTTKAVPAGQVDHFLALGATRA